MTLLALAVLLVGGWLVAGRLARRIVGRTSGVPFATASPVAPPAGAPASRLPAEVQVLFVERDGRTLLVDCVVLDGDMSSLPAGAPLALHLTEPASAPLAALVDATVDRWAARGEVVVLELRWRARGTRAHLSDGTRSMNLDLERARSS